MIYLSYRCSYYVYNIYNYLYISIHRSVDLFFVGAEAMPSSRSSTRASACVACTRARFSLPSSNS